MIALPTSGYTLDRVFAQEQSFLGHGDVESLPSAGPEGRVSFAWDWQIVDETHFTVVITVAVEATKERPETVKVMMVGEFTRVGEGPPLHVSDFVQIHAPAILMPYVREAIASLTGRGFYGALHLPPVNVQALMSGMKMELTTGMQQARANTTLATSLGLN